MQNPNLIKNIILYIQYSPRFGHYTIKQFVLQYRPQRQKEFYNGEIRDNGCFGDIYLLQDSFLEAKTEQRKSEND